jgi:hypothetical protein
MQSSQYAAQRVITRRLPCTVKATLSHADALLGQFELISSDAISVFLNDEVFNGASRKYLNELYSQLVQSPEFEIVSLNVESIPSTDRGNDFVDQFLGNDGAWRTEVLKLPRKKARIMEHWARKIGGHVTWCDS